MTNYKTEWMNKKLSFYEKIDAIDNTIKALEIESRRKFNYALKSIA